MSGVTAGSSGGGSGGVAGVLSGERGGLCLHAFVEESMGSKGQ